MTDREKWIRLANDWYDEAFKASRKQTIDEVLEIIDEAQTYKMAVGSTDLFIDREVLREEVLTLKGEHQS